MRTVIKGIDLFCGAGGTSSGLAAACKALGYDLDLIAINHWDIAIKTHSANHPMAQHLCETLDSVDPRKIVPASKTDILVASPECTHHSKAAGGKPKNDQSRASAWHVVRWAEALRPDTILIENVPEFLSWGPLGSDGKPLKSRRGETFRAFVIALESLGYTVEWQILNAADYGDPTTRKRLFIQCRRGRRPIVWPQKTHSQQPGILTAKWRTARDIIEWDKPGTSIFFRKRPLKAKTLARIIAGLEKFGGVELQPFIVVLRNHADAKSMDSPVPTLCGGGNHVGVAEPFILPHRMFDEEGADSIDRPVRTITAKGGSDFALVEPFIVPQFGERPGQTPRTHSTDAPLPTVTSHGAGALVEPYLLQLTHGGLGLVMPVVNGYALDIRFRMLTPRELARAQGFPDDYEFHGTKEAVVRQIGNAVPTNLARALCEAVLAQVGWRNVK